MNKIYTIALLLLLISGCDCFRTCNGPEKEYLSCFRYVNDDLPPLDEMYVVTNEGPLLIHVYYDSDGDWLADKVLNFSENTNDNTPEVKDIKGKITREFTTKAKIRDYFVYTPENMIMETLIEPIDANEINKKRLESPEYKKVVEAISNMPVNSSRKKIDEDTLKP